jgi:RNA polymerase sigma factor (sigma-70 family)
MDIANRIQVMIDYEKKILRACLHGHKTAWEVLVLRYSRLVYHTITNTLGRFGHRGHADVVEDLYQEFFLCLLRDDFKKLRQFRGKKGCTLASWLRVVASRLTIDYLRRQPRSAPDPLNAFLINQPDYSETSIKQEEQRLLSRAIETLSARDQTFIELYVQEALPPQEIALILRTSLGSIYARKSRVLEKLRRSLRKSEAL